jgi:multidrug resistance protein, MATE family
MEQKSFTSDLQLKTSYAQIFKFALPISAAILVPNINFFINNYFIGNYDKTGETLGIAGITGVYYLIFAVIGYGLNNAVQALISRRAGQGKVNEISGLFWNGLRISFLIAAFGILMTYTIGPLFLKYALKSAGDADKAVTFLKIRIWGLPFLYVYQMRNALLVGTNNSRYLVIGTIAETIANVFFDYAFIYGKFGFAEMGFNGAAYASILAEFIGMAVVFGVVYYNGIGKQLQLGVNRSYQKITFTLIFIQALPLIFQNGISVISWEYFYILIERHSQTLHGNNLESAVSNVMRIIFGLFGCTTWALGSTANTMVSNIIGQGQEKNVLALVKKIIKVSTGIAVCVALLLNFFPTTFLNLFGQDQTFVDAGIPVLRAVTVGIVFMSFGNVILNSVTGTGNSRINLYIELVAIVFYTFYVWLVMEKLQLPLLYGWLSEVLYWSILFTLSYLYLKSGKWKGKKI